MNILGKLFNRIVNEIETETQELVTSDPYRLDFHLMPPTGWMNDPNGLCWFRDRYHVFYQYCPFDAESGLKVWGHDTTTDFVHWEKLPVMMYPDEPWNVHGVYSGTAMVEDDRMYLFYTGNIKSEGNYDYVLTGREQNTVLAISENGTTVKEQRVLLKNIQYPKDVTLHVRDPKIRREEDGYYLILGARNKENFGELLVYRSTDLEDWNICNRITTKQPFGYMWECPDLVCLNGQMVLFLSPQGLPKETYRFQNQYSCGYFPLYGDYRTECTLGEYQELDYGFDFYAQQTFQAPDGRVLALAWMGMPDADYTNPTASSHNWQHCQTLVRQLSWNGSSICSVPADEYRTFRSSEKKFQVETELSVILDKCCDLCFDNQADHLYISLEDELTFCWNGTEAELCLSEEAGCGRTKRKVRLDHLEEVEIFLDRSSVEIFLNHGETNLSARFYPRKEREWKLNGNGILHVFSMTT